MSDQLNPVIVQRTQQKLGKYIQRPQLTDKLLKRPPFRFLHDIVTAAIKQYGVLEATFTAHELVSENIKEKDDKTIFLEKLITKLNSDLGIVLKVKPSKIVAGTEADKTNELLQALGTLIEKKQSRQKPPPTSRPQQTNGDSYVKESKGSTNSLSNQPPVNKKTTLEDTKKENLSQKTTVKSEQTNRQTVAKENGTATNASRPAQDKPVNEKLVKSIHKSQNDQRDGTKPQLRTSTSRQQTNITKSNKDSPKTQKPLPSKASVNEKGHVADYIDVASVPPEDPSIDFDAGRDSLFTNGQAETGSSQQRLLLRKGSRDHVQTDLRSSRLDVRLIDAEIGEEENSTTGLTVGATEARNVKSTNEGNFLTFNGTGNETGKLSPPVTAINNAFEKPIPDRSSSPALQSKRPPSGANRPKSSRRPPSRAVRDRLSVMRQDSRPMSGQVPRVIIEGNPFSDDEEDKIVESAVFDQSIVDFSAGGGNELLSGQQGKLVEQILSVQKGIESSSDLDVDAKELGRTNQFQQLRVLIQDMAKTALPLGHLIPLIHEDMETMQQEWAFWKKEADALEEEYNKEKASPLAGMEKLKAELEQLDKGLAEQEAKLSAAKAAVLKSENDVSLVMANFGKNR